MGSAGLQAARRAGVRVAGSAVQAGPGEWLGVRPESVAFGSRVPARVRSCEYLGADLIVHCEVGSETLTVRTHGSAEVIPGGEVALDWPAGSAHHFDSSGKRI